VRVALIVSVGALMVAGTQAQTPGSGGMKPGAARKAAARSEQPGEIAVVSPESEGFSTERLENLHRLIQDQIDQKQLGGAITILARHGHVVDYRTYGYKDLASQTPMTRDTIFRDFSMTKPVTGVAMMILYEQGKWLPWDPVSKFLPQFKDLKVFGGFGADGKMILVDPEHPPTVGELMSHTAGLTYGFFGNTPVDQMYRDAHLFQSHDLEEFASNLAKLPLLYQPGKGWTYSVSMDVEGAIVEKLSGESLPEFDRKHIFEPLGMKDAGFFVPEDKRARFASNYSIDAEEHLQPAPTGGPAARNYDSQPSMPSGGGGLVSTASDYYRFASMLLNQGELDGARVLAPSTVKLMTSNHLPDELLTGKFGIGVMVMRPGFGYGYNGAVEFDPARAGLPDGKGTYLWDGAAGTWFWVDPANDVVFVGMIQRMLGQYSPDLEFRSRAAVYGALVEPGAGSRGQ
jgi:CubicO group peptidase (beta-lactamase class C family)